MEEDPQALMKQTIEILDLFKDLDRRLQIVEKFIGNDLKVFNTHDYAKSNELWGPLRDGQKPKE